MNKNTNNSNMEIKLRLCLSILSLDKHGLIFINLASLRIIAKDYQALLIRIYYYLLINIIRRFLIISTTQYNMFIYKRVILRSEEWTIN